MMPSSSADILSLNRQSITSIKEDLANAFQLFAMLSMDDLTYTHLSARHPVHKNHYFINPLGPLFEEITISSLIEVSLEGEIIGHKNNTPNPTGDYIHSAIYKEVSNVNCVMHLHTSAGVAISALDCGLLPISQFAFHFYDNIAYHDYDGLVLSENEAQKIVKDLGQKKALVLRNHGILTVGSTIQEAFFYMYYLDQAARVQCKALSMNKELKIPSPDICRKASHQMRNFEHNLGDRDWDALIRKLKRQKDYSELTKIQD